MFSMILFIWLCVVLVCWAFTCIKLVREQESAESSCAIWRADYRAATKKLDEFRTELLSWIKNYNLLAEEQVCLIRTIKELKQEAALNQVEATYWKKDSDNWRDAWHDVGKQLSDLQKQHDKLLEETNDWRLQKLSQTTRDATLKAALAVERDVYGTGVELGQAWYAVDGSGAGTVTKLERDGFTILFDDGGQGSVKYGNAKWSLQPPKKARKKTARAKKGFKS